jgi:arylsulfatase A-like enzyme
MMGRKLLLVLLLWMPGLAGGEPEAAVAEPEAVEEKKGRPNVLFIVIDDLNDWVGFLKTNPQVKTPNLDRLAEKSRVFSQAYCPGPICNPCRTAVLTGLRPSTTGVYQNNDPWARSAPATAAEALPELFKRNGYKTMWSGKLFHTRLTTARTHAMWDDRRGADGGYGPAPRKPSLPKEVKRPGLFEFGVWDGPDSDFPDVRNAELTVERLGQKHEKPFFAVLGLYRPHNPWTAPQRFFDLYPEDEVVLPEVKEDELAGLGSYARELAAAPVSHQQLRDGKFWRPIVRAYLASVSFMDWNLGRVLDALEAGPNAENTIVVLWSDHGFHLGEKEHWAKFALWEKSTRTPMMILAPGVVPGQASQPVSLLDIYPTLVDMCGLEGPKQKLEGLSLRPLLEDRQAEWKVPAVMTYRRNDHAVRTAEWRYIRYSDGSEELYKHPEDYHERVNLAGKPEHAELKKQLAEAFPKVNAAPVGGAGRNGGEE